MYGAERIAELLGLDKSALDFDPTVETVEKEASLLSWWDCWNPKTALDSHLWFASCSNITLSKKLKKTDKVLLMIYLQSLEKRDSYYIILW